MAIAASITVTGSVTGGATVAETINFTVTNSSSGNGITTVNLTTTPTAIVFPTWARFVVIEPPAGNAIGLRLSGAVGETVGATLDPLITSGPFALPASGQSMFLFCASGTVSGVKLYFL